MSTREQRVRDELDVYLMHQAAADLDPAFQGLQHTENARLIKALTGVLDLADNCTLVSPNAIYNTVMTALRSCCEERS